VLLDLTRGIDVRVAPPVAWTLICDVSALAACAPNVSELRALEPEGRYTALVSDRLGPFTLSVPVEIEIREAEVEHRIVARLAGADRRGQARVRGDLVGTVEPTSGGTRVTLSMKLEVLGKLATIGATPMRRRADDLFSTFAQRLQAALDAAPAGPTGSPP
jgi:uncharacterized protein